MVKAFALSFTPKTRARFPTWVKCMKPISGVPHRDIAGILLKAAQKPNSLTHPGGKLKYTKFIISTVAFIYSESTTKDMFGPRR